MIQIYEDSLIEFSTDIWPNLDEMGLIDKHELNGSMESMGELANDLRLQKGKIFSEEVAFGVLADAGEVLKKAEKGKWMLNREDALHPKLLIQSASDEEKDVLDFTLIYWPQD